MEKNHNNFSPVKKSPDDPLEIFFSYSHKDEELKNQLTTHLKAMQREGLIKPWSDRDIDLSDEWKKEIDAKLNAADIILLLVSPDFVASDYCYDIEMKRAMERHEAGEARVIPLILRPTDFSALPFARLQAAPKDAKPVTVWTDTDSAFNDIARGIRRVIKNMRGLE